MKPTQHLQWFICDDLKELFQWWSDGTTGEWRLVKSNYLADKAPPPDWKPTSPIDAIRKP